MDTSNCNRKLNPYQAIVLGFESQACKRAYADIQFCRLVETRTICFARVRATLVTTLELVPGASIACKNFELLSVSREVLEVPDAEN